ncbi:MAG TPA: hypothetical protein VM432_01945, partial [Bdellovibrionales bacterium]|nr:hypothetical protein [Bdellovibrionales bacterium]
QCWCSSWLRKSPTFYASLAHLFLTSLPLTITRFANYSLDFGDVRILGLPGPVFHGLSSAVYLVLILSTIFDLVRSYRLAKAG